MINSIPPGGKSPQFPQQESKKAELLAAKSGPLGILPYLRPALSGVAYSDSNQATRLSGLNCDSDGVIPAEPGRIESRVTRFIRQSAARKLLPDRRVSWCLRRTSAEQVNILKSSHGAAHFSNVLACARPWECTCCASKISERRRSELVKLVDAHKAQGGSCLLLTFTFSHTRFDSLSEMLPNLDKAWKSMTEGRPFKKIKEDYNITGSVRALEVTWGASNGWHPHYHVLWFSDSQLADSHALEKIKARLYLCWLAKCSRFGLGVPSYQRGVDVRDGSQAAKYAAKFGLETDSKAQWGMADELARAHTKNGRNGHYSPFQLLDFYIDGDKQAGALFVEYVTCFSRPDKARAESQLVFSKGLKKRYKVTDRTDEELAAMQDDKAVLLGSLSLEDWKIVLRQRGRFNDSRAIILTLAETGGMEAVNIYLADLRISPPS